MTELQPGALEFLRRRVAGMFPGRRIDGKLIAENIAFGAAVLGAGHVELVDRDGWWFVASEFNWLVASKAHAREIELFETMLPFPEQSPTGHRAEIYVTAFAEAAYFRVGDAVTWLRGETDGELPDRAVVPAWCTNVLAFRCPEPPRPGRDNARPLRTAAETPTVGAPRTPGPAGVTR